MLAQSTLRTKNGIWHRSHPGGTVLRDPQVGVHAAMAVLNRLNTVGTPVRA